MSFVSRATVEIKPKPAPSLKILELLPLDLVASAAPLRDDTTPTNSDALTTFPAWGDGLGLAIAERVEDARAANTVTGLEAWAAGDGATMATLAGRVPSWAECVTIIARDGAASAAAARQLAASLAERKIEARIDTVGAYD